jgi:hypothetical protein
MSLESTGPELITIVEGPTPDFHIVGDPWAFSVVEGNSAFVVAACQVRSFNGQKLLDRCLRAWRSLKPIRLDFKEMDGLRRQVEIVGARLEKIEQVDVLNLWVRQPVESLMGGSGTRSSRSDSEFD